MGSRARLVDWFLYRSMSDDWFVLICMDFFGMAYNPQYGIRSCFSRPFGWTFCMKIENFIHKKAHPSGCRTCWVVTSLERKDMVNTDPEGTFHLNQVWSWRPKSPDPRTFLQMPQRLDYSTRTYSLASSLPTIWHPYPQCHSHVFSDAGGAQWKRKGLRAAIISNTHRITWIYIWIISVLCKMNHQNHTKHNAHLIRIHVQRSLSKPNQFASCFSFKKVRVSTTNSSPISPNELDP